MPKPEERGSDTDEQDLFFDFVKLVPLSQVESRVKAFMSGLNERELRRALGHPNEIVSVAREFDEIDEKTERELRQEIGTIFSASASNLGDREDVVRDEAQHAQLDACRLWMDLLMFAFESANTPLELGEGLQPRPELCVGALSEWNEWREESLSVLLNDVALTERDISELEREYHGHLLAKLKPGARFPMPLGFEFTRGQRGLGFQRRVELETPVS